MYKPEFSKTATYSGWDLTKRPMVLYTRPYNPIYFLTKESALLLAELFPQFNPIITKQNAMIFGGPFTQSEQNVMIDFHDVYGRSTGPLIAGVFADAYFNHGYSDEYAILMATNQIFNSMGF
jgi:hypothetical protein